MMNVSVICVGKLKESYLREGCSEYIKRLGAFAKVSVIEVAEERCGDSPSASEIEKVLQKEGERIIAKIPKGAAVVPLCIEGSEFSSPLLAQKIEQIGMSNSSVAFIIGGSFAGEAARQNKAFFRQNDLAASACTPCAAGAGLQGFFDKQQFKIS